MSDDGAATPVPGGDAAAVDPRYAAAWDAWVARFALELLDDPDRSAARTIAAPAERARPRQTKPRRIFGLLAASYADTAPWVTLRRVEDHLVGRCVAPERFGSGYPVSPEEDAALLTLGWHHPGPGDGAAYVRWWPDDVPCAPYLPAEEARNAARTVAATMRDVFGVEDPAGLVITRD